MLMQTMPYGFGQEVALPYQEALDKTKAALKDEGFGVLCLIDVRKTMKQLPETGRSS
jgi:uncharacterized protein (DUF302 family)